MGIYITLFIYVCVLGLVIFLNKNSIQNKKLKKLYLILAFVPMALLMGFRDITVGSDTLLYGMMFENYGYLLNWKDVFNTNTDTLVWSLYNKIILDLFQDYHVMLIINSFIICGLCAKFIYDNSDNVVFSTIFFMTFYHYFSAFNISRQYIAIMIAANSFKYVKEKKVGRFILLNIIAISIHNTAICALVIGLFFKDNIYKTKNLPLFFIGVTIVALLYENILNVFMQWFPHYSMYENYNEAGEGRRILVTLFYIAIFAFGMYVMNVNKKVTKEKKQKIEMLNMINLIAIIIALVGMTSLVLARVGNYFSIYIIILLPAIIQSIHKKDRFPIYFFMTLICMIPMVIQLKSNHGEIIPYVLWK